jgi:hypothetical protein
MQNILGQNMQIDSEDQLRSRYKANDLKGLAKDLCKSYKSLGHNMKQA